MPRPPARRPALACVPRPHAIALLCLLGCGAPPQAAPESPAKAAPDAPPNAGCRPIHAMPSDAPAVTVRVAGAPADDWPTTARLVLSRLPPDDAAAFAERGFASYDGVMPFIRGSRVYEVDPRALAGAGLACALPASADGSGQPVGLIDLRGGQFWSAVFSDRGPKLVGGAPDGSGPVALRPLGVEAPPPPSAPGAGHCAGPRYAHLDFADPLRHACALLPPNHDPKASYPVVYMLSGFAGDDTTRFGDRFTAMVDGLAEETGRPALYVGVSTRSDVGSLYPTAESSGPWLDWLTETLPAAVEARLGGRPGARALFGQSTGGFNAITIALLRPDGFQAVGASAPDALDMADWLLDGEAIDPRWYAWMRLEDGVGGAGQMVSYAAAWSPDGKAMPADLDTGALRAHVLDGWLAHSPIVMLDDPSHQAALRGLGGRLRIAVARNDQFGLTPPAQRFAARLDALGIAHHLMLDDAGHFGLDTRLPVLLRAMLGDLALR